MNIKQRILKIEKIVNNRIPDSYYIPIKIYSTIYSLFRACGKEWGCGYKKIIKYYESYFKGEIKNTNPKYINTRYAPKPVKSHHRKRVFNICAIADYPIKICANNMKDFTNKYIAFYLLHEIGHHYLKTQTGQNEHNEILADTFAIRWMKKFEKEHIL